MAVTIVIKNMVCPRCIKSVQQIFENHGQHIEHIALGKVQLNTQPLPEELQAIRKELLDEGFEIIDNRNKRTIDRIKSEIIDVIHHHPDKKPQNQPFSQYLAQKLYSDYSSLSKLFSATEGRTIERFIIAQKIEKVKELMVYDELTLSEIAYQLGYSSVQHLSGQFRRETGFSPSTFKKQKQNNRKPLDNI